jgi:hypothetical protein
MRARTEEGGKYRRLSHVMGNGLSTISSCWTELSEPFSTCCLCVLCPVSLVFNGNKTSFLTRVERGFWLLLREIY